MKANLQNDTLSEWLNYLESKPWFFEDDTGPNRVKKIAQQLGCLDFDVPIITVAGTNGKGTTVAALESFYTGQGYSTGSFTSPHILKFNERIRLNKKPVNDALLCQALDAVEQHAIYSLRYFDYVLLAALWIFQDKKPDIIFLEVGLGGLLDATNAVDADVSIITSIDLDHMDVLGGTREEIASHKAGIMRKGKTTICGDRLPPSTLTGNAAKLRAPLELIGKDFDYFQKENQWCFESKLYDSVSTPVMALIPENIACALQAVYILSTRLPIRSQQLAIDIQNIQVAGRCEIIHREQTWVFDVAHNPVAVKHLARQIKRLTYERCFALFSMHKDKQLESCIIPLIDIVQHWYVAPLHSYKGANEKVLVEAFKKQGLTQVSIKETVASAYRVLSSILQPEDLVICYGSFETLSQVMQHIE